MFPSRNEAEKLFMQAAEQNPQPWVQHCRVSARVAETIAANCGMDANKAYILGLFHDIGYSEFWNGKGKTCHILIGYELMKSKEYDEIARICLTHSFAYQDIRAYSGSDMYCSDEEMEFISAFMTDVVFDDYDKLIQLCDCLGAASGVCLMEQRFVDVSMRHGFKELTLEKWKEYFALKDYFDKKCGVNVYGLFRDEIGITVFG